MLDSKLFRQLTDPASVAVVGASDPSTSAYGGQIFRHLVERGGRSVHPVNRRLAGTTIGGLECVARVSDLAEAPELVIVVTPSGAVPDVLEDAAASGCRTAIVVSSYQGADAAGSTEFDGEVKAIADAHGMCVLGPNTIGVVNAPASFVGTFGTGLDHGFSDGGISLVSQSGAAISFLVQRFAGTAFGFAHLISTGNEAALDYVDLLEAVVEDGATRTLLLVIEGIRDGQGLRRALRRAHERGIRVGALKLGISAAGATAAKSHTGRLTGQAEIYEAVFEECGVVHCRSYSQLFDVAMRSEADQRLGARTAGRKAAVVTVSGGLAVAAADALADRGWSLPQPSDSVARAVGELAEGGAVANPYDIAGLSQPAALAEIVDVLSRSHEYDEVFLVGGAKTTAMHRAVDARLGEVAVNEQRCPVAVSWLGLSDRRRTTLASFGLPVWEDPLDAIHTATLVRDTDRVPIHQAAAAPDEVDWPSVRASPGADGAEDAFGLLASAGLTVVDHRRLPGTASAEALVDSATELGFPVVLKVERPGVIHKTEHAGVFVDIRSASELVAALEVVRAGAAQSLSEAALVVQSMVDGVEVLVGAVKDDVFGHVLTVGVGGTRAELLKQTASTVLPASGADLRRLVESNQVLSALLSGYRGAEPADTAALHRMLTRLAVWLTTSAHDVVELDLNPVIVTSDDAVIVDVAILGRDRA